MGGKRSERAVRLSRAARYQQVRARARLERAAVIIHTHCNQLHSLLFAEARGVAQIGHATLVLLLLQRGTDSAPSHKLPRSGQCRLPGPSAVRSVGHSVLRRLLKTVARYEQTCGVDDSVDSAVSASSKHSGRPPYHPCDVWCHCHSAGQLGCKVGWIGPSGARASPHSGNKSAVLDRRANTFQRSKTPASLTFSLFFSLA